MTRSVPATLGLLALVGGCSDEPPEERAMPAPEGAVQPAGDGRRIDEAAACAALSAALSDARQRLDCPARELACPAAIRPAGSACQAEYDQGSLDACRDVIDGYARCEDFEQRPCYVTAYLDGAVGCAVDAGAGGAAGAAGAGGGGG